MFSMPKPEIYSSSPLKDYVASPTREPGEAEGQNDNDQFVVYRLGHSQRSHHMRGDDQGCKDVFVPSDKHL